MIFLVACGASVVILGVVYFYKLRKHQKKRESCKKGKVSANQETGLILHINIPQNGHKVVPDHITVFL